LDVAVVFSLFVVPIMLLNFASGIVGGIWLAVLGQWSILGGGILAMVISTFALSIALMPGLIFVVPAIAALERGRFFWGISFSFFGSLWTYGIMALWCVGSFVIILSAKKFDSFWPYLFWSYAIATGPWTYMASQEIRSDPNSSASLTSFSACVGSVIMMLIVISTGHVYTFSFIQGFSIPMVFSFALQMASLINATKSHRRDDPADSVHVQNSEPEEQLEAQKDIACDPASQEDKWYVFVNGKELGPANFSDLVQLADRGVLPKDVNVRHSDSTEWVQAGSIPSLFAADESGKANSNESSQADRFQTTPHETASPSTTPSTASESRPSTRKMNNYIARHWRGELSLPVSYWVNGVLSNIVAAIVITAITAAIDLKNNFRPDLALASTLLVWVTTLLIITWQVVGVWRSASNYQRNSKKFWGGIAKFIVIITVLQTIGTVARNGLPQINELYKIYAGDKEVGKYAFRVLRNGRELEFSGGITFGAAKEFQHFIGAMGALRLVHLNSPGGRILEAQRIAALIRTHKLSTYVDNQCMSACTIIFLAGRERLISKEGKLGFHQPNFPGWTDEQRRKAIADEERQLLQLGVAPSFARKATLAPPKDIWIPTTAELVSAHVITKVVSSLDYALSGFDPERITPEKVRAGLLKTEIYVAIRKFDPQSFSSIVEKLTNGIQRGAAVTDLTSEISPIVMGVLSKALPYTSDIELLAYTQFMLDELKILNSANSSDCYLVANPEKASPSRMLSIRKKYPLLFAKEAKIQARVISSASNVRIPTKEEVTPLLAYIVSMLRRRNDADISLIVKPKIMADEYGRYCKTMTAYYEEVLKLPTKASISILRYSFASK
jgi:hypothetical protein